MYFDLASRPCICSETEEIPGDSRVTIRKYDVISRKTVRRDLGFI
jgi:hypothetical protein